MRSERGDSWAKVSVGRLRRLRRARRPQRTILWLVVRPSHIGIRVRDANMRKRVVIAGSLVLAWVAPAFVRAAEPTIVEKALAASQAANAERDAAATAAAEATDRAANSAAAVAAAEQIVATAKDAAAKAAEAAKAAGGDLAPLAKDLAVKATTAAQAAEQAVAAAKAVAQKLAAEKTAAEKTAADRAAAAKNAAEKVLAERAFAANMALRQAGAERDAAQKQAAAAAEAARVAGEQFSAAQQAAALAGGESEAAAKALAEKAAATTAASAQAATEQDAEKKKAFAETAASLEAERRALEQAAAEKTNMAKTAADNLAKAKAALEQTSAQRTAAEKTAGERTAAVAVALDNLAVAEAEAMGGLKPIASGQWDYAKARHLLARAGFGGSPEDVAKLHAMGLHGAVDFLVEYHRQPACTVTVDIRPPERPLGYEARLDSSEQNRLNEERTNRERVQQALLRQWWLRRMVETPRPLEEKLALFWHDHFATGYEDKLYQSNILLKQNELFREHADKFDALLRGIIHDPAMIIYLDNHVNVKGRGNENLGREVLELFSLGRDQGYSEQDLRELSRALTGYTYVPNTNQFRFNTSAHDEGPKTLLGRTGNFSGDEAIDVILGHPSTARYAAKKLFEYFAYRQPADELTDRLAHVLRSNQYELGPMLKNLFLSEEFYSERSRGQHIKSPIELMVGAIRTLKLGSVDYGALDWQVQNMGMTLFQPPNVSGWEEGRYWISANRVLLRYNGVANLVEQPQVDVVGMVQGKAATAAELVEYLAGACLAVELTAEQKKTLIGFVGELPPGDQWTAQRDQLNGRLRALLVLMMSTPAYQVS